MLEEVFGVKKPIIGMIHLAGDKKERVRIALEELFLFYEEGINGAIIEDYHGSPGDVRRTFQTLKGPVKRATPVLGANVLANPYRAFEFANQIAFIQFDSAHIPQEEIEYFNQLRRENPHIKVLAGVGFKYQPPTGNPLEQDLEEAKARCDVIVTTGEGTGIETPIGKLRRYKEILKDFPLFVGAGVTLENVREQLEIADGAIVGSYFKQENATMNSIDRNKVRDFMQAIKEIRG